MPLPVREQMAPQDCLVFSENSPQLTLASENSVDF